MTTWVLLTLSTSETIITGENDWKKKKKVPGYCPRGIQKMKNTYVKKIYAILEQSLWHFEPLLVLQLAHHDGSPTPSRCSQEHRELLPQLPVKGLLYSLVGQVSSTSHPPAVCCRSSILGKSCWGVWGSLPTHSLTQIVQQMKKKKKLILNCLVFAYL